MTATGAARDPEPRLGIERKAGVVVVSVRGPLDVYTAPDARERLEAEVAPGDLVVVDLAEVSILDSSGLTLLLRLRNRAQDAPGGRLGLACPHRRVRRILDISGLGEAFPIGRDAAQMSRAWAREEPAG